MRKQPGTPGLPRAPRGRQLLPHRLRPPAQAELSLAAGNTSHIDQSDSHDTAGGVNMLLSRHPRRPSLHESRAGP
ncbi:hypothetical protein PXNS11_60245 [Stutzerimonas xanthomarina]|nr:hypothetical protein PXNS11_60245 [Stutzerimonas xanthomarina]